ncbi:Zinc finger CCCH domain-containing protein 45 [Lachnellula arida]|uniref:Zinc finger CCCH domain-containing protein 45 n=1 Tax=Lachnellula arida TaxID=1316785 RepID=A0A8T9BK86_9HELO|nr:Zinc finger CCCH domain-containing protein 45 [Lachnellula arida]
MAFILVQCWGPLPTVHEEFMGDQLTRSMPSSDYPNSSQGARSKTPQVSITTLSPDVEASRTFQGIQQSNFPQNTYPYAQSYSTQQHASQGRSDSFNLASLGGSLPDSSYQPLNSHSPRQPPGQSPSPLLYQMQGMPQYAGPQAINPQLANASYNLPYQSQFLGMYTPNQVQSAHHHQSGTPGSQLFQGQAYMGQPQHAGSPYYAQPNVYGPQSQMYSGESPVAQYGLRSGFLGDNRHLQRNNEFPGTGYSSGSQGRPRSVASNTAQSSVVRGPPRKPRQSGHAIWIGNLPPQTDLMNLVFHVCKEAPGLESLFLISKSNCAFANYKDEAACAAAQAKIHDSRFQTVRLVSRLRRSSTGTAAGLAAPTGPAALTPPSNPPVVRTPSPEDKDKSQVDGIPEEHPSNEDGSTSKDKFFIVKSLTVEDLELSVRNGIWATQSHNEEALNKAYKAADNVYLVFSANKSGEYFGYARMTSPINDDPSAAIQFAPKAQSVEDPELPKAIPTPVTEFSPKGRIIDDSARGTIFWEVERDEVDGEEEEVQSNRSDEDTPQSKAWGKPFKIEWISTMRLPFYRTRGLRNPWNSNREVKIARDGTELETSIGRRLLGLFHRVPSPVAPNTQGLPLQMVAGYPQMRPFP